MKLRCSPCQVHAGASERDFFEDCNGLPRFISLSPPVWLLARLIIPIKLGQANEPCSHAIVLTLSLCVDTQKRQDAYVYRAVPETDRALAMCVSLRI